MMKIDKHKQNVSNDESVASGGLGISQVVMQLRDLRLTSLENRKRRDKPPKLPSRKSLQTVIEGLAAALFPNRLGLPDLKEEGVDYFVGHTLDVALRELFAQVKLELNFAADTRSQLEQSQSSSDILKTPI